MENLIHLVYASRQSAEFSQDAILELLAVARSKNQLLGITGMLVYSEGSFFQVLEGDEAVVMDLYAKIGRDGRHTNTVKIIEEPIAAREFNDWSMGYSALSKSELERFEGMNDFFVGKTCLADVDEGRAKLLLGAFAEGRWRLT